MPTERRVNHSRRTFLRLLGVSAGAGLGGSLLAHPAKAAGLAYAIAGTESQRAVLRVGVVLPRSRMMPMLGSNLLGGLQSALVQASALKVAFQPLWYEDSPNIAVEHAKQFIEQGSTDVIVAAMNRHEAIDLGPALEQHSVPLIVADVGAQMLRPKLVHPWVFRSSLNHWQSAWALGQWAAQQGKRVLIASAFYDSGFDTIYAFWSGFEQAGGEQPHLVVTHRPNGGDFGDVQAAIRAARPDMVFAAYSGQRAAAFLRDYAAAGFARSLPLLGADFLADTSMLDPRDAAGILSARAVPNDLPAHADAFTRLGYATGALVRTAAASGGALRDALAASPVLDPATLETRTPIVLHHVQHGATGASHTRVADLTTLAANRLAVPTGPRSGWRNAYLMV